MSNESRTQQPPSIVFAMRTDPADYDCLWRTHSVAKALHFFLGEVTLRGTTGAMPTIDPQDLRAIRVAITQPDEVISMLRTLAADQELREFSEAVRRHTDETVRVVCDGIEAMRRVCADHADLVQSLDALDKMERLTDASAAARRRSFWLVAGGKS